MLTKLGQPQASVKALQEPRLQGVQEAMNRENIRTIIRLNAMVDLFLLCVDRDGNEHRTAALSDLETNAAELLRPDQRFFAASAWQEIEVWALAGHDLPRA